VDKWIWDNIELLSQVTMEQPTNHQASNKFTNTPKLKIQWTYPTNEIGNESTKKESQAMYIPYANHGVFF